MLDRIRDASKEKVQFYLPKELIRDIKKRAADLYKTQSKYIAGLVEADLVSAAEEGEE